MKTLTSFTNDDVCEFLLSNKKANALELSSERSDENNGFTKRVIYKDKTMEIIYSFLEIEKDDVIEQFTIYSTWWGKIKNSYFTLEGFKGKSDKIRCGVININDLKDWNSRSNHPINNHNSKASVVEVTDFASFTLLCQKVFKASPSYEVKRVIRQSPDPLVEIKVIMPDGTEHLQKGSSKKDAANKFAVSYKW